MGHARRAATSHSHSAALRRCAPTALSHLSSQPRSRSSRHRALSHRRASSHLGVAHRSITSPPSGPSPIKSQIAPSHEIWQRQHANRGAHGLRPAHTPPPPLVHQLGAGCACAVATARASVLHPESAALSGALLLSPLAASRSPLTHHLPSVPPPQAPLHAPLHLVVAPSPTLGGSTPSLALTWCPRGSPPSAPPSSAPPSAALPDGPAA